MDNNFKARVLCSATCQYNNGNGYYNICHHPSNENLIAYGGIDRYYTSGCDNKDLKVKTNNEE